jgi:hypothetical protein
VQLDLTEREENMGIYSYEVSIHADTEPEAQQKLKAAITLIKKLKTTEIKKLADIVENDPAKTAMAKRALGV